VSGATKFTLHREYHVVIDRAWLKRNLGFDPVDTPPPADTFAVAAASKASASPDDLRREMIEFDSEAPAGRAFLAFTPSTGLSRFVDIPWPKGLAPKTGQLRQRAGAALPRADVLVVTWTADEGHTLSRVLTPGKDSGSDYLPYTNNFATIAKKMVADCPARQAGRLGVYWTTSVGTTRVVVFKSDSHMSQDGPQLPNRDVWRQIILEVQPTLVITTGTGGGIGASFEVGDVVVSPVVRFDCTAQFKKEPFHSDSFSSAAVKATHLAEARRLITVNADQLPKDNTRPPRIVRVAPKDLASSIVTTDFFGFDTSDDRFHLEGLGAIAEMGDAVLGLVTKDLQDKAPRWVSVRNVSDPQIKADGLTLRQQAQAAAQIYKAFGRWSTVCSAIACWALIAAE
jgi:hypothetical protein